MKVVSKYITVEILKSTSIALLFLMSLTIVITFADELGDMGKGTYGLTEIFKYIALITPRSFYELLPSAALLGALVTLGGMANSHELTAMRAAGISRWQIIAMTLKVGAMLMVVSLFVSEVVSPVSEQAAQMLKFEAKKGQVSLKTKYGFWTRDNGSFINIREIVNSTTLKDISVYKVTDDNKLAYEIHATHANFINNQWKLEQVKKTSFEGERVVASQSESMLMASLLDPNLLDIIVVKPDRLSILGLVNYIEYLESNGQNAAQFVVALTSKLLRPFVILVMLLIAIPFVLGVNRVSSIGTRILIGTLIGIGFHLVSRLFGNVGIVYGLNPIVSASLPFFLALLASAYSIRRMG